jgi:hypothetical protein
MADRRYPHADISSLGDSFLFCPTICDHSQSVDIKYRKGAKSFRKLMYLGSHL